MPAKKRFMRSPQSCRTSESQYRSQTTAFIARLVILPTLTWRSYALPVQSVRERYCSLVGIDRVNLTGACRTLRKCSPGRPLARWAIAAAMVFASVGCNQSRDDAHAREVATRVRSEFLHAWTNYEKYAWGHDALKPLSKTSHDWYGKSLLMTPVDALDTLILMKLDDEAAKAKELIVKHLSFESSCLSQPVYDCRSKPARGTGHRETLRTMQCQPERLPRCCCSTTKKKCW